MTLRLATFAAVIALAASAPALATAAPASAPATRTAPAAGAAAQPVTRAQVIKNLDAQFRALDKNGDGMLTKDELAAAQMKSIQQQLATSRARMDTEFTKLDTNKDGQLSKAEFMAAAPPMPTALPDVSASFAQFDTNKDGKITFAEYQAVMIGRFDALDKQHKGTITEGNGTTVTKADFTSKLGATFKLLDGNGDGAVTKAELQAAELKIRQQRVAAGRTRMDGEFTKLDTDKNGQLSRAEFMAAAPSMPAKLPDGSALLAQIDKNKDGKITPDEYKAPLLGRFDAMDSNHDGTVTPAERQAAMAQAKR